MPSDDELKQGKLDVIRWDLEKDDGITLKDDEETEKKEDDPV